MVAGACPFCDNVWDTAVLRAHVQAKLEHLKEFSRKRQAIERKVAPVTAAFEKAQAALETLIRHATLATPAVGMQAASDYRARSLYARALVIWEKALGPEHPDLATCLENYALCLSKMGRSQEAEPLEARAKAIRAEQNSMPNN